MLQSRKFLSSGLILTVSLIGILIVSLWLGTAGVFSNGVSIFAGQRPSNLGLTAGQFAPCPVTPNCVSSQSSDSIHAIAPLTYSGKPETAIVDLTTVIESFPRAKVISSRDHYVYAEFTSALMGFVDDVEFYVTPSKIEVRSASRLGESDLGVNRQRVEAIRARFQQQGGKA